MPRIFFFILLITSTLSAQYRLPKQEVLARDEVSAIAVSRVALRLENRMGLDVSEEPLDTARQHLMFFYFNDLGKLDSVRHYPSESGFYVMDVMVYNQEGRLVRYMKVDKNRKIISESRVDIQPNGELYMQLWDQGVLHSESFISSDSILYETRGYGSSGPGNSYSLYTYDLKEDIDTQSWYSNGELMRQEIHQWISEDGVPISLIHTEYEKAQGDNPGIFENGEYAVAEDGSVINEMQGLLFDPFRLQNFYKRHKEFNGLTPPFQALFTLDNLMKEQESTELLTFDGTEVVYRYEFDYTFK